MHYQENDLRLKFILISILTLSLVIKVILTILWPQESGDKEIYYILAKNLIRGCGLSKSSPEYDECELISGTYFPGFPILIAFFWKFISLNIFYLLIFNCLIFTISFYFLIQSLLLLPLNRYYLLLFLSIFALSPLQSGWFRFIVLTEPLAISLSILFLSELITSISKKKLRSIRLALILSSSVFIRPDTILMAISILPVTIYIHNFKEAITKVLIFIFVTSIPVGSWMTRNILIGHKPISIEAENNPGFEKWTQTWITNEYERGDATFPLYKNNYEKIKIHNSKYINKDERIEIERLINLLKRFEGHPFPNNIDNEFRKIAEKKIKNRDLIEYLEINAKRSLYILLNPFSSFGMPFELKSINKKEFGEALFSLDINYLKNFTIINLKSILGKGSSFLYRVLIIIILIILLFKTFHKIIYSKKFNYLDILTFSVASYFFLRLAFFITIVGLESRYMIESIIWLEALGILYFSKKRDELIEKL